LRPGPRKMQARVDQARRVAHFLRPTPPCCANVTPAIQMPGEIRWFDEIGARARLS
jgi:hypothetical protein